MKKKMSEFFEENFIFITLFLILVQLVNFFARALIERFLINDLENNYSENFSFSLWEHIEKELLKEKYSVSIFHKPYRIIIYFQYFILALSVLFIVILNILNQFQKK